jgi:hypothetical protein
VINKEYDYFDWVKKTNTVRPLVMMGTHEKMLETNASEDSIATNCENIVYENSSSSFSLFSLSEKVLEWLVWSGEKTFDGMEFAGEVLANVLGLTQSKYQWMIDMAEREKEEKRLRKIEERQRRQLKLEQLLKEEQMKLAALEKGESINETNSSNTSIVDTRGGMAA